MKARKVKPKMLHIGNGKRLESKIKKPIAAIGPIVKPNDRFFITINGANSMGNPSIRRKFSIIPTYRN